RPRNAAIAADTTRLNILKSLHSFLVKMLGGSRLNPTALARRASSLLKQTTYNFSTPFLRLPKANSGQRVIRFATRSRRHASDETFNPHGIILPGAMKSANEARYRSAARYHVSELT